MKNILLLVVLISLTPFLSQAQLKKIKLINSETLEPISKVSIFLVEENNGTVSNEYGEAKLGNTKSSQIRVSHLNFETLIIQTADLKQETTTFKLKPRTAHQIEEVVITAGFDQSLIGKWRLKGQSFIYVSKDGSLDIVKGKTHSKNIKEYKADRTFTITSSKGYPLLHGTFIAMNNQVHEKVISSSDHSLDGITNILFYSRAEKPKEIRVKYQLPKANAVTEEIWKKIN